MEWYVIIDRDYEMKVINKGLMTREGAWVRCNRYIDENDGRPDADVIGGFKTSAEMEEWLKQQFEDMRSK